MMVGNRLGPTGPPHVPRPQKALKPGTAMKIPEVFLGDQFLSLLESSCQSLMLILGSQGPYHLHLHHTCPES